jgi:hypothetical protein
LRSWLVDILVVDSLYTKFNVKEFYMWLPCSSCNLTTYNRVFVFLAGVKRALWSLQSVRQGSLLCMLHVLYTEIG